jgi:hypothetical protein
MPPRILLLATNTRRSIHRPAPHVQPHVARKLCHELVVALLPPLLDRSGRPPAAARRQRLQPRHRARPAGGRRAARRAGAGRHEHDAGRGRQAAVLVPQVVRPEELRTLWVGVVRERGRVVFGGAPRACRSQIVVAGLLRMASRQVRGPRGPARQLHAPPAPPPGPAACWPCCRGRRPAAAPRACRQPAPAAPATPPLPPRARQQRTACCCWC